MSISENLRWKGRTAKVAARSAARAAAADVRAARAAHAQAEAKRGQAEAAANAERERALKLACPCCRGEGRVTVEQAERTYRSHELLPSYSKPDLTVMATLASVARGEAVHGVGPRITEGLSYPTAPAVPETAKDKYTSGASMLRVDETEDGALIEP